MPDDILELPYQITIGKKSTTAVRRNIDVFRETLYGNISTGTFAAYIDLIPPSIEVDKSFAMLGRSMEHNNTVLSKAYVAPNISRSASKWKSRFQFWRRLREEQIPNQSPNQPYHVVGIYDDMSAISLTIKLNQFEFNGQIGAVDPIVTVSPKDNLFTQLFELQNANRLDDALDLQFRTIENWIMHGKLSLCQEFLSDLKIGTLNNELLTALLVVTKPWKNVIPTRNSFSLEVKQLFIKRDATRAARNLVERLI